MKHWTTRSTIWAAAGFIAAAAFVPAQAADISGAGATFPYPIYAKWADAYKKETGNGLNYQSIGSGGGIKQIKAKTVTFGATDAPLKGVLRTLVILVVNSRHAGQRARFGRSARP